MNIFLPADHHLPAPLPFRLLARGLFLGALLLGLTADRGCAFEGHNYKIKAPPYTMAEIEKHIVDRPRSAEPYCDRAQAYLSAGECEEAVKDYSLALALEPRCKRALVGRSQASEMMGRHQAALLDVEKALAIGGSSCQAEAIRQKITILLGLKKYGQCPGLYDLLLKSVDLGVGPKDRVELLEERGRVYLLLNEPALALQDFSKARSAGAFRHYWIELERGRAYAMTGQAKEELQAYNIGIKQGESCNPRPGYKDSRLSELYLARAAYWRKHGKAAEALADEKRAKYVQGGLLRELY